MKIILTLDIPENHLAKELLSLPMSREEFKKEIKNQLSHGMDANEICPGATCSIEILE